MNLNLFVFSPANGLHWNLIDYNHHCSRRFLSSDTPCLVVFTRKGGGERMEMEGKGQGWVTNVLPTGKRPLIDSAVHSTPFHPWFMNIYGFCPTFLCNISHDFAQNLRNGVHDGKG